MGDAEAAPVVAVEAEPTPAEAASRETTQPIILVAQTLTASPKPLRRPGRRPGQAADTPDQVPVARLTVVFSDRPLADEEAASAWMRQSARDEEGRTQLLSAAIGYVNRALHAAAIASADPYLNQLDVTRALAARIGHGLGPELAEGRFSESIEVPPAPKRRRRRTDPVVPLERVAAILAGRSEPDLCETFLLRARADLDAGRPREAALCQAAATDSLLSELEGVLVGDDHRSDLNLVAAHHSDVAEIAARARRGPITAADISRLDDMLSVCERILRRRQLLQG